MSVYFSRPPWRQRQDRHPVGLFITSAILHDDEEQTGVLPDDSKLMPRSRRSTAS